MAGTSARVRKREDHDLFCLELVHERKRESIQHRDPAVAPIFPLRRRVRKLKDRFENGVDLVFQLGSKLGAARLVIVDLVIDLDDRESMDSKLQRLARATLRLRMWTRYSSRVIVSVVPLSATAPRLLDLNVPRLRRVRLRFAVETTDQLERQARALLRREAKNVCKNVGRSHAKHFTHFRRSVLPLAKYITHVKRLSGQFCDAFRVFNQH